jgi:hypothetical protein
MLPRKRNSHRRFRYTLDYKKKVLQSVRNIGLSKTLRKMDVKKEQIHYWLQKEQEILNTPNEEGTSRYRLSKAVYGEVAQEEQQLYQWIMDRKRHGEHVLNDEIIERATTMFSGLPEVKTKASRRWLVSFKRRFGLSKDPKERVRKVSKVKDETESSVKCEKTEPVEESEEDDRESVTMIEDEDGEEPELIEDEEPEIIDLEDEG